VTGYLDGYHYVDGALKFFPHAEGYVNVFVKDDKAQYNYVYNYTDHLGNIRLSWAKDPQENVLKILEENHYYPYGLKHRNYNYGEKDFKEYELDPEALTIKETSQLGYKYKYNGKEWQGELALNMYDMDMRDYDPAIARWVNNEE
jgi:hypothetical protein